MMFRPVFRTQEVVVESKSVMSILTSEQRKEIRSMLGGHVKFDDIAQRVGCTRPQVAEYAKVYREDPDYVVEQQELAKQEAIRLAKWRKEQAEREEEEWRLARIEEQRVAALNKKYETVTDKQLAAQIRALEVQLKEPNEVAKLRKAKRKAEKRYAACLELVASIAEDLRGVTDDPDAAEALIMEGLDHHRDLWEARADELHDESHADRNGWCQYEGNCWNWSECESEAQQEACEEVVAMLKEHGLDYLLKSRSEIFRRRIKEAEPAVRDYFNAHLIGEPVAGSCDWRTDHTADRCGQARVVRQVDNRNGIGSAFNLCAKHYIELRAERAKLQGFNPTTVTDGPLFEGEIREALREALATH